MSTLSELEKLVSAGKLILYEPADPEVGFKAKRKLYVTQEILQACPITGYPRVRNGLSEVTIDATRVLFEDFIGGEEMEQSIHLTLLKPHENQVWEFRVCPRPPAKYVRAFGWFTAKDVFVATHLCLRELLGDGGSAEWTEEIEKCIKKRGEKYSQVPTLRTGTKLSNYLSDNVIDS